jgi:hypothetical protein
VQSESIAFKWAWKCRPNPIGRQASNLFKRSGFFKEVRCAGHDFQLLFAAKFRERFLVQSDHDLIVSTHDEKGWRLHLRQSITREVGPSAARDHGLDPLPDFDRSHKRCTGAGTRPKIADADVARLGLGSEPLRHFRESARKEGDVKPEIARDVVFDLLFCGQQIKEQRAIACYRLMLTCRPDAGRLRAIQ